MTIRINNSLTLKALYRKRLRQILQDEGIFISESDIHRIVRERNKAITDRVLGGEDVRLPYQIGTLALRKKTMKPRFIGDKLVGLPPMNWKETRRLGVKVYSEYKTVFKILLIKKTSSYHVKNKWRFRFTTSVNKRIYELATTDDTFDALEYVSTRKNINR